MSNKITMPNDTNVYTEHSIRTYTGKVFDLQNINPDSICIEDIAHALSLTARFAGHTPKLYSVAQHSYLVSSQVPAEHKLAALLHDASEAYIGDMPSPLKKLMPDFKLLEDKLMHAIANKFGFEYPFEPIIKEVDKQLLRIEWNLHTNNKLFACWNSELAERTFLNKYYKIIGR